MASGFPGSLFFYISLAQVFQTCAKSNAVFRLPSWISRFPCRERFVRLFHFKDLVIFVFPQIPTEKDTDNHRSVLLADKKSFSFSLCSQKRFKEEFRYAVLFKFICVSVNLQIAFEIWIGGQIC
jgi:hypothetical protein